MRASPAGAMSDHVVDQPMTSQTMTSQAMTSVTDHSVESILRHNSSSSSMAADHVMDVNVATGNTSSPRSRAGERCVTSSPEVMENGKSSARVHVTKPHVQLECADLWRQFDRLCTEMVITKSGRLVARKRIAIGSDRRSEVKKLKKN